MTRKWFWSYFSIFGVWPVRGSYGLLAISIVKKQKLWILNFEKKNIRFFLNECVPSYLTPFCPAQVRFKNRNLSRTGNYSNQCIVFTLFSVLKQFTQLFLFKQYLWATLVYTRSQWWSIAMVNEYFYSQIQHLLVFFFFCVFYVEIHKRIRIQTVTKKIHFVSTVWISLNCLRCGFMFNPFCLFFL